MTLTCILSSMSENAYSVEKMDEKDKIRTLDVKQRRGEIVKPGEIIGLPGMESWNLADRRTWNLLLENAWAGNMEDPTAEFQIALRELRGLHDSNDRLRESLRKLQKTLVTVRLPEKGTRTVQMLGATDIFDSDRTEGLLKYDFHRKLVPVLRDSKIYARMDIKILNSFTSKYALSFFEVISSKINLSYNSETLSLDDLRLWLGVEGDKLRSWSDLRVRGLEPAIKEVNALSLFSTRYEISQKIGRKVVEVRIFWGRKQPLSSVEQESAKEVNRVKIGRRARINNTAEIISQESPFALSDRDIQKGVEAATPICALDKYAAYYAWLDYVRALPDPPKNLVGHWISFCKKRAQEAR